MVVACISIFSIFIANSSPFDLLYIPLVSVINSLSIVAIRINFGKDSTEIDFSGFPVFTSRFFHTDPIHSKFFSSHNLLI